MRREQAWSRIHLVPLILAEQDRDAYRRQQAAVAREREIMKDVEGWEVSTRKLSRYIPTMRAACCVLRTAKRYNGKRGLADVWCRLERAHTTPRDIHQTPLSSSRCTKSRSSRPRQFSKDIGIYHDIPHRERWSHGMRMHHTYNQPPRSVSRSSRTACDPRGPSVPVLWSGRVKTRSRTDHLNHDCLTSGSVSSSDIPGCGTERRVSMVTFRSTSIGRYNPDW